MIKLCFCKRRRGDSYKSFHRKKGEELDYRNDTTCWFMSRSECRRLVISCSSWISFIQGCKSTTKSLVFQTQTDVVIWLSQSAKNFKKARSSLLQSWVFFFLPLLADNCPKLLLVLCCLNPCLDLELFPQMPHGWFTPDMWFASMCFWIFPNSPSFPHTLQILAFLGIFPTNIVFPLWPIINHSCSFSWWR